MTSVVPQLGHDRPCAGHTITEQPRVDTPVYQGD